MSKDTDNGFSRCPNFREGIQHRSKMDQWVDSHDKEHVGMTEVQETLVKDQAQDRLRWARLGVYLVIGGIVGTAVINGLILYGFIQPLMAKMAEVAGP